MKHYVEEVGARVKVDEGIQVIEKLLLACYFHPGISTKELARRTFLPIPVAAAIKKELIREGALEQKNGVHCTKEANRWVERRCGYRGINRALYLKLMEADMNEAVHLPEMKVILERLEEEFARRPQVNVQLDQSKCTTETSLRRAILCLKHHSLVGKKILCVGDDDLVSVSLGMLLQQLFPGIEVPQAQIDVVELDERFIRHIHEIADRAQLPIRCFPWDLRNPLPSEWHAQYDCFFTDPPYTLQGMSLFVSRGITALKQKKGLPVFLSFAHKSPDFMLAMNREFVRMGLTVHAAHQHFNQYEGAEMIANRSQMIVLETTAVTDAQVKDAFSDALYTGEVKRTLRTYRCMQCGQGVFVGLQGEVATIEELKNQGCPGCKNDTFLMVEKRHLSPK
ncbi:bis-aminopropyl spermidine synthase family protein [Brevibacillus panacihumi]|uniref:bis-aminopropyl spermidine synthase family protein n=1 Tax=Brevibacillus panacihumi TaxID=497735 RepID=UPI003D1E26FF